MPVLKHFLKCSTALLESLVWEASGHDPPQMDGRMEQWSLSSSTFSTYENSDTCIDLLVDRNLRDGIRWK